MDNLIFYVSIIVWMVSVEARLSIHWKKLKGAAP